MPTHIECFNWIPAPIKIVDKLWGREQWIVQEPEYWCKRLFLDPGYQSSLHYHMLKKETFVVESGFVHLEHPEGKLSILAPGMKRTIQPTEPHRFWAEEPAVILEVSTCHNEEDVVRLEPSCLRKSS